MSTPAKPTVCVTNEFLIVSTSSTTNQLRYKNVPDQAWPYSGSMASCNGIREDSSGLWVDPVNYVSGLDNQANTTATSGLPLGVLTAGPDQTWTWTNNSGLPQQLIMTTDFRWIGTAPTPVYLQMKCFVGLAAPVAADWTSRPVRASADSPANTPGTGTPTIHMNAPHICQIACAAGSAVTIHRVMGMTPTAASGTATPTPSRWGVQSMIWAYNTPNPTTVIAP